MYIPNITNITGIMTEKYPNAPLTKNPEITTPIIPSQLAVLKFDDWFSLLNSSVIFKLSRRDWSISEYETMLKIIRKLNRIRKNPRICFLFAIGSPSSYFLEEREDESEEPEDFSRLL